MVTVLMCCKDCPLNTMKFYVQKKNEVLIIQHSSDSGTKHFQRNLFIFRGDSLSRSQFFSHRVRESVTFFAFQTITILSFPFPSFTSQAYIRFISDIYQIYLRLISGISQVCLRYISGIFQVYLRQISGIYQVYLSYISGIPQTHLRHTSSISQVHL